MSAAYSATSEGLPSNPLSLSKTRTGPGEWGISGEDVFTHL